MEPEIWSVEVKGDESYTFKTGDEFLHITEVALGEVKDGEEVKDLDVYWKSNCGENQVLRTLSSEGREPEAEAAPLVIYPYETIELSHGWKGGIVRIVGRIEKCLGLEHFHDIVYGEYAPKASSLEDITQTTTQGKAASTTTSSSIPTLEECMEIVEGFTGFEQGSSGYKQALYLFYSDESARVHFMIPKTPHSANKEFLEALIASKTN